VEIIHLSFFMRSREMSMSVRLMKIMRKVYGGLPKIIPDGHACSKRYSLVEASRKEEAGP